MKTNPVCWCETFLERVETLPTDLSVGICTLWRPISANDFDARKSLLTFNTLIMERFAIFSRKQGLKQRKLGTFQV